MAFTVAKNGMRMYQPSWQANPGGAMKAYNRAKFDSYVSSFSTLGQNLLGAVTAQSASQMELTTKIVTDRLGADFEKKLAQAKSGLDVSI